MAGGVKQQRGCLGAGGGAGLKCCGADEDKVHPPNHVACSSPRAPAS